MGRPKLKNRNRNSKTKRLLTAPPDKGCEGVIRRRLLYAKPANDDQRPDDSQTYDAIGRMWSAGLLGHSERAVMLRDTGRAIAAQYARFYGGGHRDSLASFQPRSTGNGFHCDERMITARKALDARLASVGPPGSKARAAFDALVIDPHPDYGPPCLERLIAGTDTLSDRLVVSIVRASLEELV